MYQIVKRVGDILIGIVGCIFMIPITLYVILLRKKYKDTSKLFFCQYRIGKNGKLFKMYKYQTMVENADALLEEELKKNPYIKAQYEKNKKIENDFRVTKSGEILRRCYLDEWPQFINVVIGNMSVVGPRPYLEKEKPEIKHYEEIIKLKPGITGLWQTNGGEKDFATRNELDFQYCQKQSFLTDIKLMKKTIKNMINLMKT